MEKLADEELWFGLQVFLSSPGFVLNMQINVSD